MTCSEVSVFMGLGRSPGLLTADEVSVSLRSISSSELQQALGKRSSRKTWPPSISGPRCHPLLCLLPLNKALEVRQGPDKGRASASSLDAESSSCTCSREPGGPAWPRVASSAVLGRRTGGGGADVYGTKDMPAADRRVLTSEPFASHLLIQTASSSPPLPFPPPPKTL